MMDYQFNVYSNNADSEKTHVQIQIAHFYFPLECHLKVTSLQHGGNKRIYDWCMIAFNCSFTEFTRKMFNNGLLPLD